MSLPHFITSYLYPGWDDEPLPPPPTIVPPEQREANRKAMVREIFADMTEMIKELPSTQLTREDLKAANDLLALHRRG